MSRACLLCLFLAGGLCAQNAPGPELALDINGQADAVASRGGPLLIRVAVFSADGGPLGIALKSGAWTQALSLSITDQNGAAQKWPVQLVPPAAANASVSGYDSVEAVWLVAPSDTAGIPAGVYNLSVTLDTTGSAASGAWSGAETSTGAGVTLNDEPSSLAAEDEATKYLALAAYARLKGDSQGAGAALDTLISRQPGCLEAYSEKGALREAAGDSAGALSLYRTALDKFLAANPNPKEPLTLLTLPIDRVYDKIAAQQQGGATGDLVTSVAPGRVETMFAPDSIVTAYGSGLTTQTASASVSLSTTLAGATVTITDSTGTSAAAPLLYVSGSQVDYAAPASLALGQATVTVKSADGSTRSGKATIADVQPAVFTLNAAGLVAGTIVRATASGQQVFQDIYSIDGSGAIVPAPVDLSKDQVYMVFYATGIRRAPQNQVSVSIGGVNTPVAYAGSQGSYTGLDQVNVQIPTSLAGRGDVPLVLTVNGVAANPARVTLK